MLDVIVVISFFVPSFAFCIKNKKKKKKENLSKLFLLESNLVTHTNPLPYTHVLLESYSSLSLPFSQYLAIYFDIIYSLTIFFFNRKLILPSFYLFKKLNSKRETPKKTGMIVFVVASRNSSFQRFFSSSHYYFISV